MGNKQKWYDKHGMLNFESKMHSCPFIITDMISQAWGPSNIMVWPTVPPPCIYQPPPPATTPAPATYHCCATPQMSPQWHNAATASASSRSDGQSWRAPPQPPGAARPPLPKRLRAVAVAAAWQALLQPGPLASRHRRTRHQTGSQNVPGMQTGWWRGGA